MIVGKPRGGFGWYEFAQTIHLNILVTSLTAGVGAGITNWWQHDAGPVLVNLIQSAVYLGISAAFGFIGSFVKSLFTNHKKESAPSVAEAAGYKP